MDQAEFRRLKLLFEPAQTPDELDKFLREVLNLDLPWDTVGEESNSAPLKFVWQINKTFLTGEGAHRHVVASARNGAKTLASSVVQFISLLHYRRDGNHISATLEQSAALIRYIDKFLGIPELAPYRLTDNVKRKELLNLPKNDFTERLHASLQVVTSTRKGANSSRASTLSHDEVEMIPEEIIAESAWIADPTQDSKRMDPVFIYLSSRKSNDGTMQKMIDEAEKQAQPIEIKLHKWALIDFQEKCLPEVHKPELGKFEAYMNMENLEIVWGKENFEKGVPASLKAQYKELSLYDGCRQCPAVISCQGRAPNQRGDSKMLRTRKFIGGVLKAVGDPAVIIAQGLNLKPETTALVFRSFTNHKHVKDPVDFYAWITGGKYFGGLSQEDVIKIENEGSLAEVAKITPSKDDIYQAMIDNNWTVCAGNDWGYSPDPAFVIIVGWHRRTKRCAVLHMEQALNHANHIWARYIAENVFPRFPFEFIAPDLSDPASPTYYRQFHIRSLDSKPSRIETGVSQIRGLLWNPIEQNSKFCILDDSQTENQNRALIDAMLHWTHKKTGLGGYDMEKFADDKWTHATDSLRYSIAPFVEEVKLSISSSQKPHFDSLPHAAAAGDKEAQAILEKKKDLQVQVQEEMLNQHGIDITAFFQKPTPADDAVKKNPNAKGGGSIKFKF